VQKSDGSWTYFAPDIAYHYNKVMRGFDELINIFGADHSGYVKRLKAVVSALSENKVTLDIKLIQLVKLLKGGQIVKMSKRAGTFVTLRDLIDEVGPDVVRFVMLTRKNDVALDFDFDKVTEQSKDNPVFYVQYANARVNSVLRKAREAGLDVDDSALSAAQLSHLAHEAELEVIRKLGEWPHRVAFYLYELASDFHGLWNRGNDDDSLRFIQPDTTISTAKIALVRAVGVVICAGLGILGVTPVEEMR
jgi:arginyl-tRNA synthetase